MSNIYKFLVITVLILMIASNASATPKVILTFDDGWTSVYYKAFPIMQSNNQKGVSFLITSEVPTGSGKVGMEYMNLTQVNSLYSAGWDLSSHTVTHPQLTTLDTSTLNVELKNSKDWLNASGFTRASQFLAYPYGEYNANVITAVKNNGYLAARTVEDNNGLYPQYKLTDPSVFGMKTLMICGVTAATYCPTITSPSYIKNIINNTISSDGLIILSFHNIIDSGLSAPEDYLTSDFQSISDFLRSKENAGQLKVVAMSEYFLTPSPTSTISPTPGVSPSPSPTSTSTPHNTTVKINANADTYVSSSAPKTNYGTAKYVYVDSRRIGYFKYDVSSIPPSAIILNAELHDVISWSQASGTSKMFPVTGTWTETGINWNNKPSNESANFGVYSIPKCNTGAGDCVHITTGFENIVQRWVSESLVNNGFMITTPSSISGSEINSRETGYIPYLLVTYTTDGTLTPNPTPSPAPTPKSTNYISHIKLASGFYKVNDQKNTSVINIYIGDNIEWVNDGANRVTLVSTEKLWENKNLITGSTYTYTFNKSGKYTVYLKGYSNKNQIINVI